MNHLMVPLTTIPNWIHLLVEARENQANRIEWVDGPETLLHPTALSSDPDILGLNLGSGCVHQCSFCSVRVSPGYPKDQRIQLVRNLSERLNRELARRHHLPRAVFLAPALDPFPASKEVQDLSAKTIEVLSNHGVECWLMTRGIINHSVMDVLARNAPLIRTTIGITTLDAPLNQALEPLTASPKERLEQIRLLRQLGIQVNANLDPLIPGLTDTRENLEPLVSALADVGIDQVSAGYLFLREGIVTNLRQVLIPLGYAERVFQAYEYGPNLETHRLAKARFLPRIRRQKGYALLTSLASRYGIRVVVSQISNPDFAIPQTKPPNQPRLVQLYLINQEKNKAGISLYE